MIGRLGFEQLFSGALIMGYAIAALFFLRFWRDTRDRLFAWFSATFLLLAFQRIAISVMADAAPAAFYLIRLLAFVLILWAIVEKNRRTA